MSSGATRVISPSFETNIHAGACRKKKALDTMNQRSHRTLNTPFWLLWKLEDIAKQKHVITRFGLQTMHDLNFSWS
jgi:hypothetical protein